MFEYLLAKPKVYNTVMQMLKTFSEDEISVGGRLPTVRQLAEQFEVSVYTFHSAVNELKTAGFVKERGKNINFLDSLPKPEELIDLSGVNVSLLVRDYSDISKLNSMLIREQMIKQFKKNNPEISICEIQTSKKGSEFSIEQIKSLMRESVPTTNQITQTELPIYHKFGLLAPIDEKENSDFLSQFKPNYIEQCRIGEQLYLLPSSVTISCYTYNSKVFEEAGVDSEKCFLSLDNFRNALKKLTEYTKRPALNFSFPMAMFLWLQQLSLICGERKIDNKKQLSPFNIDAEENDKALEIFHQIVFEDKTAVVLNADNAETMMDLYNDQIPIIFDTGTMVSFLMGHQQTDNYSIAQLGGVGLANLNGEFVNAKASKCEQLAAIKLIKHAFDWRHKGQGASCLAVNNRFSKPWSIFKNPEEDDFLCNISNFPVRWQEKVKEIESNIVWEPLGNEWEKLEKGIKLQSLLDSGKFVSKDGLKFYLKSINFSSVSGDMLAEIMALG